MRKILLFVMTVFALGMSSCKKVEKQVDKLLTFTISDEYAFQMPAVPFAATFPPQSFPTSTDATEDYRKANTAANLVKDVKLDALTLTATGPSGSNFDFLENVTFYISTDMQGTDRVQMASLMTVPRGVSTINLEPSTGNLDKYLKAENYVLTVQTTFRTPLRQNTDMRMNYQFKVTADPL
ncbi:hypothetical protein LJY25_20710 [Hymenobacter sp. BT175]|uniref:hypothetical protein n=1 Tax=Hymenobacter translucens TaxID=2886507 RepID=UPI001D0DF132|nr:hypothetical protein [Hymenobacter translucens]MCC2548883.1 hypothetical protein [Hymenobacter translucens]